MNLFGKTLATFMVVGMPAHAATITLLETDFSNSKTNQADFDNVLSVATTDSIGTFMDGTNTVSGSLGGFCYNANCAGTTLDTGDAQDSFSFVIAADSKITGIMVTKTDTLVAPINMGFSISDTGNQPQFSLPETSENSYMTDGLDIGAGTYFFSIGARRDKFERNDYAFDWSVKFFGEGPASSGPVTDPGAAVNVVPVPAGLPLLVAGLGLLGVMKRRAT